MKPVLTPGKRIERRLKRLVFGRLAGRAPDGHDLDFTRVQRVLLVRANFRLGNLVMMLPALPALRAALPDARIDVLCGRGFASLLDGHPDVADVVAVDRRRLANPLRLWAVVRRLRAADYDLVIDGGRGSSFLGAVLTWLSGARRRAASTGCRYQACFNVFAPRTHAPHKLDMLLGFLSGLGIEAADREPSIHLRPAEIARATDRLHRLGIDATRPLVGISLAGRAEKALPIAQVAELANRLRDDGCAVVVFPGPEEQDRLPAVRAALTPDVVVAPLLPIRDFAAVLSRCQILVTADSGPMHLAAAVGIHVVTAVRSLTAPYFLPRGTGHRAVPHDAVRPVAVLTDAVTDLLGGIPASLPPIPAT